MFNPGDLAERVRQSVESRVNSSVQTAVNRAIPPQLRTLNIPGVGSFPLIPEIRLPRISIGGSDVLGGSLQEDGTTDFDPLQTLMFDVQIEASPIRRSYIKSVKSSDFQINTVSQNQNAKATFYPDRASIDKLYITFYEDTRGTVIDWITKWHRKIFDNRKGVYGLPKDYKREISVSIVDSSFSPIYTRVYEGTFPLGVPTYDLDVTGGTIITPTIAFSVDNVRIQ